MFKVTTYKVAYKVAVKNEFSNGYCFELVFLLDV